MTAARHLVGLPGRVAGRLRRALFDIASSALAASLAWSLAGWAIGPQPVFAPIAAVIGLSPGVASRRRQTLGMLLGVVAGILVGGAAQRVGLPPLWSVPAVTLVAMLVVAGVGLDAVMVIQAAASALVVIGSGLPGSAVTRLADAAIGAAVALAFSQALFPADPVRRLKHAVELLAEAAERLIGASPDPPPDQAFAVLAAAAGLDDGFALIRDARRWTLAGQWHADRLREAEREWRAVALPLVAEALRACGDGRQTSALADRVRDARALLARGAAGGGDGGDGPPAQR